MGEPHIYIYTYIHIYILTARFRVQTSLHRLRTVIFSCINLGSIKVDTGSHDSQSFSSRFLDFSSSEEILHDFLNLLVSCYGDRRIYNNHVSVVV